MPKSTDTTQRVLFRQLGGLDERHNARPPAASRAEHLSWHHNGGWMRGPGWTRIDGSTGTGTEAVDSGHIVSMAYFSRRNGRQRYLVYESSSGELRQFAGGQYTITNDHHHPIYDSSGENYGLTGTQKRTIINNRHKGTVYQTFADRLYMVNGVDAPLVFNGRFVERAGFEGAPPPLTVISPEYSGSVTPDPLVAKSVFYGLAATNQAGAYRYKVTFVNRRGQESPASEASELLPLSSNSDGRHFGGLFLPTGGDHVVARRIYRTLNLLDSNGDFISLDQSGDNYYFCAEIRDNATTLFTDTRRDASLGALLIEDDYGSFPADAHLMAVFKNTMFIVDGDGVLRYSRPLFPEMFPPDNRFPLSDSSSSGEITGLYTTRNALIVLRQRGIWLVRGDPVNGFSSDTLTVDVGCICTHSIKELPGLGLTFLSEDGVYLLQGALANEGTPTNVVRLSEPIDRTFSRLNRDAFIHARAAIWHREREYWLCVASRDSTYPDTVLVYHYEIGQWTIRPDFNVRCLVETNDENGEMLIGSWQDGFLYIATHGTNVLGAAGTSIQAVYETVPIDFGSVFDGVQPLTLMAKVLGYGETQLAINTTINRQLIDTRKEDLARTQLYQADLKRRPAIAGNKPSLYGTAVWGTSTNTQLWSEIRPVVVRWPIKPFKREAAHELQVRFQPVGAARFCLIEFAIEIQSGPSQKILVASETFGNNIGR